MNTDYYRVVLKAASLCSVTKTAEEFGYTQSGVSHIIAKVESAISQSLFIRTKEGIFPLPSAERYLNAMQAVVTSEDALFGLNATASPAVSLRIASVPTISSVILPGLLKDFLASHPKIHVEVIEKTDYPFITESVQNGQADIGFVESSACNELAFSPILNDSYFVVFPHDNILSDLDVIDFDDMKGQPFIIPEEAIKHERLASAMKELNCAISSLPVRQCVDDYMTLRLVEQSFGISIVPGLYLHHHNYAICARPLKCDFSRTLGICVKRENTGRMELKVFIKYTQKWIKKWH